MAAGIIPRPGTSIGPCDAKAMCGHVDCMNNVQDAESTCYICGKRIGYDTLCYYRHGGSPEQRENCPESAWAETPLRNSGGDPLLIVHEACAQ